MEDISFKEIYIEKVLTDIKNRVKMKIILDEDRENQDCCNRPSRTRTSITDEKMRKILDDLIVNTYDANNPAMFKYNFLMFLSGNSDNVRTKFVSMMVLYYTALYFDSLDLLYKFFQNDLIDCESLSGLLLCALDKEFSSVFDEKKYFEVIKNQYSFMSTIYDSVKELEEEQRKEYFERFAKIINKRDDISLRDHMVFTKEIMDQYDDECYLNATPAQFSNLMKKKLKSQDVIDKAKNLIKNTNFAIDYSSNLELMLELFTEEELVEYEIGFSGGRVFEHAKREGSDMERVKTIYLKNRNLEDYSFFLYPNLLEMYDNDTLAAFSEDLVDSLVYTTRHLLIGKMTPEKEKEIRRKVKEAFSLEKSDGKKSLLKSLFKI